jgi:hypothetical protein
MLVLVLDLSAPDSLNRGSAGASPYRVGCRSAQGAGRARLRPSRLRTRLIRLTAAPQERRPTVLGADPLRAVKARLRPRHSSREP